MELDVQALKRSLPVIKKMYLNVRKVSNRYAPARVFLNSWALAERKSAVSYPFDTTFIAVDTSL